MGNSSYFRFDDDNTKNYIYSLNHMLSHVTCFNHEIRLRPGSNQILYMASVLCTDFSWRIGNVVHCWVLYSCNTKWRSTPRSNLDDFTQSSWYIITKLHPCTLPYNLIRWWALWTCDHSASWNPSKTIYCMASPLSRSWCIRRHKSLVHGEIFHSSHEYVLALLTWQGFVMNQVSDCV